MNFLKFYKQNINCFWVNHSELKKNCSYLDRSKKRYYLRETLQIQISYSFLNKWLAITQIYLKKKIEKEMSMFA